MAGETKEMGVPAGRASSDLLRVVLDFETRSRADLRSTNAAKYAKHPSTEVLCMSYQVEGYEPALWVPGEEFPLAEWWPCIVEAFNAEFELSIWEHVCVPKYGWPRLPLEHVECLQARAAYAGLPRKLEYVCDAAALGKAGKDSEGHKTMLKVTKPFPLKLVGWEYKGGKFNESPELHARNEAYCLQDSVAEDVLARLAPSLPETEQKVWRAHRRTNVRGVPVDVTMCETACRMVDDELARLSAELHHITGGIVERPTQIARLKDWLLTQNCRLHSLAEDVINWALDGHVDMTDTARRALSIRKLSRDAAVSKYRAILNHADEDGRCRQAHVYYKAGPGRWAGCLTGDHEVLTKDGWVRMDEWQGGHIACWQMDESIAFADTARTVRQYDGEMVRFSHKRIDQLATPNHYMPVWSRYTGQFSKIPVTEVNCSHSVPFTGSLATANHINRDELRVLVMVQADGHYTKPEGNVRLHFAKHRKVERCRGLLRRAGILFTESDRSGRREFLVRRRHVPLWLRMFSDKTFGPWIFDCDGDTFFDELRYWDSYKDNRNKCDSFQYCTTNKTNADLIQAFAHLTGRAATMSRKRRAADSPWADAYYVQIWGNASNRAQIRTMQNVSTEPYQGPVYCAKTNSGFFLVRRNGKVWVTGNSGPQFQNMRRLNKKLVPTYMEYADRMSRGETPELEEVIPTLGAMCRLAVCAPPGRKLRVCDYSSIEMRGLHWVAGDEVALQRIRDFDDGVGADPYKIAAASIYNVQAAEIGDDDPRRQIGKVQVLGCGYMTGANKFMAFCEGYGIDMPMDKAQEIVQLYRRNNPLVVKFWYAVGKAATKAIKYRTVQEVGRIQYYMRGTTLNARLPSGRELRYYNAELVSGEYGDEVEALDQRSGKRRVIGLPTLIENLVQAACRDLLADAMLQCERENLDIVLHVHDELVEEVDEDDDSSTLSQIMASPPQWAEGLPVACSVGEARRYVK